MATITITHTHEDGTLLTGSKKGDGVYEIVRKHGFEWRRNRGICINVSRDRDAKTWYINAAADALRAASHEVIIEIDNTARPTAVVEAERRERADDRVDRLTERAGKAHAAGDARRDASRRITDGIPFGQPVQPPGHHSRKAHLNALDRVQNHRDKAVQQWKKGEHLAERAAGAAANQTHRDSPRTIMRRIEKLEADIRRYQRELDGYERNFTNGRGEIVQVEKHPAATGSRREDLRRWIAEETEKITYWRGQLDEHATAGTFVAWVREHFVVGDRVRHAGFRDWYEVTRVNAKSVSVKSDGWPRTIPWDKVAGRRRDGMQWDTPNGEPWPVDLARKVARWPGLARELDRHDYGDEAMRQRIRIAMARCLVLGLDLQATAAEVDAFLANVPDLATERQVQAAFVDVYDRLTAGELPRDVQASFIPIQLKAQWRMPDREPERRPAARTGRLTHDIPAVAPGDLVAGWYEWGPNTRLMRGFCGPVAAVSEVQNRRERGEFATITLTSGQERTFGLPVWLAVHPAGTWEEEPGDVPVTEEAAAPVGPEANAMPDGTEAALVEQWNASHPGKRERARQQALAAVTTRIVDDDPQAPLAGWRTASTDGDAGSGMEQTVDEAAATGHEVNDLAEHVDPWVPVLIETGVLLAA
ncbi:DUF3560 domain-containing protein [Actinoplanes derwentensis]|uniref:DUF3560 domain-containing protein n=1 Tax=Actinoplanes derwentensis TaxID=113562 RepID=A0A1H2CV78_9ACTN|nr:DUF3560 domain-containing protein [Actinoplanes derwentensis]GID81949.1 hypothetical protein Ade03nite_08730 [Actinoplanes derwentensis]SDT74167.1 protein of unknown function [Actinoplanes derwentensis]